MEIKSVNNADNTVLFSSTASLSTRDEVRNAIATLKAKGIKDWEILDVWSEIAHEQGNDAIADTLASAAFELGKPSE